MVTQGPSEKSCFFAKSPTLPEILLALPTRLFARKDPMDRFFDLINKTLLGEEVETQHGTAKQKSKNRTLGQGWLLG